MKILNYYMLILCVLASIITTAQQLTPPIQNFSSVEYKAASQNWDIKVDEEGFIYAANNQGLLVFDGQRWRLFPLKNNSIIRSVYPHEGRIYVGSYQEFGYWSRTETGKIHYTSLMPLLGDYTFRSEEFWEILSYKDAIYFRSFGAIYKYENDEIIPVKDVVTDKMVVYQDKLLLAVGHKGLHFLEDNGDLTLLPNQDELLRKTIVDIEVRGEKLFIGTREALYVYEKGKCIPYPDKALNDILKKSEPNQLLGISEDELVIGTVKNGIIHLNEKTGDFVVLNRNNGLQNNTVLSMAHKDGKVWLGLDNGVDVVNLDYPIKFYTDDSGELGSVYDVVRYGNDLYVASNTGVYKMLPGNDFAMVPEAEGHSWNLEVLNGNLYSNHNTGTYWIYNNEFKSVGRRTGSFQILNASGEKHLIGTYHGIDLFDEEENTLATIPGTLFPVKQLVFENSSTLWAAHAYEGLYKVSLSASLDSANQVKKIIPPAGVETHNAEIFKINNHIAALLGDKWYKYNVFKDTLEVFKEMKEFNGYRLISEEEDFFWFLNNTNNSIIGTDFKDLKLFISSQMLNDRLVKGNEKIIKESDSIYYVTLHDGFAAINLNELLRLKAKEKLSVPKIQGLSDRNDFYNITEPAEIPYNSSREISFSIGLPYSDASSLQYELTGENTLRGEVNNGILNFQNLDHGNYKLKLKALSPQNNSSEITTYDFTVMAPWYLSNGMKFLYFLVLLGLTGLVFLVNRLKLEKHRLALEERYEKEHEEQLNRLEKEKLMNEITLKRKELANSTMIAAKKNEVLMEIQGELTKDKNKFSNEYRLKHIMSKINRAIKDKDEWKVFETNFNELHEDFFKDLLARYPKLSNKDLKLCSYLKMNLTSKEIAPLMGISVRGVEVHRYRLRKKMDLDSIENLTNFLIANF